jgi:glycosyltransferase involved in cell wall biosynthesis
MTRTLNILAPTRYPWRFNSPRRTRHNISVRTFAPLNKLSPKIEGVTVFNPWPIQRIDLIHAFNRIPLGAAPFIISFESHLPRGFGIEDSSFYRFMTETLASSRCRGIVAISDYARRQFLHQHRDSRHLAALSAKLQVRYPNLPMPSGPDAFSADPYDPIRMIFVGAHFARKGGTVVTRLAERALREGLNIHIDVVSALEMGAQSWVAPTREGYYDRDRKLLETLPNITHHGSLPNADVLALLRTAHFSLLPTFSDSFGYSALESMACGTPMIATPQCALPEFITDTNGILLPLATDALGEWDHIHERDVRDTPAYETMFDQTVDALADAALARVRSVTADPAAYLAMRRGARATAEQLFSDTDATAFWDDYYSRAVSGVVMSSSPADVVPA